MLRLTLEKAVYTIIAAPNGQVGIELYRENPTDLIITDLIMPGKKERRLFKILRKSFRR